MTVKRASPRPPDALLTQKNGPQGLNQSLLRERRKPPFAWRRLGHLGERFSIVQELGPPQDRGRGGDGTAVRLSAPGAVLHDVTHQVVHVVLQIPDDVLDDVSDRDHAHDLARV